MTKILKNKNLLFSIGLFIAVGALYFIGDSTDLKPLTYISIFVGIALTFALAAQILNLILDRYFPWETHPNRIYINIVAYLIVMGTLSFVIPYQLYHYFSEAPQTFSQWISNGENRFQVLFYFITSSFFSAFFHAKGFYTSMKESMKKQAQLVEENKQAEINALTQQLNPHFLFNNLNILHSLIDQNPKQAQEFIQKMSSVYRYVLQVENEDWVPLTKEIHLAQEYLDLLKIRLGDSLDYEIEINESGNIIPLSLQLSIENAVKHNQATKENPLKIKLYSDDNQVIVENKYQPKSDVESNGKGLQNLEQRYALLNSTYPSYGQKDGKFYIKIPLQQ